MARLKTKEIPTTIVEKLVYKAFVLYAIIISLVFVVAFSTAIYRLVKDPGQMEKASFGYAEGGYFE